MIFLAVPYEERREAKRLGGRWFDAYKAWYVPTGRDPAKFERWMVPFDHAFPGEDRSFEQNRGLFVDLIPETSWFTNIRSHVAEDDWRTLRRIAITRAMYRCEICRTPLDVATPKIGEWGRFAGRNATARLDVHERWSYDEGFGIQKIERLICLCFECHMTTHMGFAEAILDRRDDARRHLAAIRGITEKDAEAHVLAAVELWERRSQRPWTLDLTMVQNAGFQVMERDAEGDEDHYEPEDHSPYAEAW